MTTKEATTRLRIVLLCGRGPSSNIVFHHLMQQHDVVAVVEARPSRRQLVRRRWEKLGPRVVLGQLLFQGGVVPMLSLASRGRRAELLRLHRLSVAAIPKQQCREVDTVNDPAALVAIGQHRPEIVVVNGTRIISQHTIDAIGLPMVNLHAGITPMYRGVHGGYWALAEGQPQWFGVTLHRIDAGIDTGGILAQATGTPTPRDNFSTYPLLQLAMGLPLLDAHLIEVVSRVQPQTAPPLSTSRLRSHPTLAQYLSALLRGVR